MKYLAAGFLAAASLATVSAQKSKVNPPNHSEPGPQYYIYQDIDYISYPNSSTTACPTVKAIRYKCYSEGIKKNSYFAEQQCLCTPDTAYQVTQCFAKNYGNMPAGSAKDAYYNDYLDYIYDCYCGVTGYDVSYNTTNNPPTPWVKGYTGDCIVPPAGGCPAKQNDNSGNRFPTPPCGCTPPPKPPQPACPSGYQRVNDCCVPNPPPPPMCDPSFYINSDGECVCPYPGQVINGQCQAPSCPDPNQILVQTPRAAYCECGPGYDEIFPNVCDKVCPAGEARQGPRSVCQPVCSDPNEFWNPNTQECICADWLGYHINHVGQCVLDACQQNEVSTAYGCMCPDGFYYDENNNCVQAVCTDLVSSCSPDSPAYASTATEIVSFTTAPPSYTPYTATTTYNTSYNSLVPYSSYTQSIPVVTLGNATTTQSIVSFTSNSSTPTATSTTSDSTTDDSTSTSTSETTSTDSTTTSDDSTPTTSTDDSTPTDNSSTDGGSATDGSPSSPTARPRVRRAKAWKRDTA